MLLSWGASIFPSIVCGLLPFGGSVCFISGRPFLKSRFCVPFVVSFDICMRFYKDTSDTNAMLNATASFFGSLVSPHRSMLLNYSCVCVCDFVSVVYAGFRFYPEAFAPYRHNQL